MRSTMEKKLLISFGAVLIALVAANVLSYQEIMQFIETGSARSATVMLSILTLLDFVLFILVYFFIKHEFAERKRSEQALLESEERFRRLSDATLEGVAIHEKGIILDANQIIADMLGYEVPELIGMNVLDLAAHELHDLITKNITADYEKPYESMCLRKDGSTFPVEICAKAIPYQGRTARVTTVRDITERKRTQKLLLKLATYDDLTGLRNRREMNRIIKAETRRYRRYGSPVALILLDIDHFKDVNDCYGHQVGDEVLCWLARLLKQHVRDTDMVARYGGEEFTIIMPQTTELEALKLADRLRLAVSLHPFTPARQSAQVAQIHVTISLGVAGISEDAPTAEDFIRSADNALYEAKRHGRNRVLSSREPQLTAT